MKAAYEINKIKALILYILKESGGTLDFITLFKNMYFSQKEYLVQYGKPMFKDSFRALRKGPVPSFTYTAFCHALNDFTEATDDIKNFDSSFHIDKKNKVRYVSAKDEPDMDQLAGAEVRVLNKIIEKYKGKTPTELSDESHDKAWEVACERAEDDPRDDYMSLVNIARAGGANDQILNHIRQAQAFEVFCRAE
jgi:uncharacterized phage-associated protein